MSKPVVTLAATILSAITCGATFLFALVRQFAMVEIAASIVTGVQLYLLSSTVGDLIEGKTENEENEVGRVTNADWWSDCSPPIEEIYVTGG
jgi:hypothetical protein